MPELEILEIEILVLALIATGCFLLISLKKAKELLKWIPSFIALSLGFLFTNLEAIALPDLFNLFEHIFYMMGGVLMCIAAFIEIKSRGNE